jgi:SAM-dependent methyltransferase
MPADSIHTARLSSDELVTTTSRTIEDYDQSAQWFWEGTRGHDVVQNIDALLRHIPGDGPHAILDFGCGPGRDLQAFKERGHNPSGLEGSENFVQMARKYSGCEVLHQDFLKLDLPPEAFDGVFANASIFHVPSQELPRVLKELWASLKKDGVFFSSNPRGGDVEGWNDQRYGTYLKLESYRTFLNEAGFEELEHYYRPPGKPREQQPWLASVWRKTT